MSGVPPRDVELRILAVSVLPSLLLIAAALLRRRSAYMQLIVAAIAVVVAGMRIAVIQYELQSGWSRATGLFASIAWLAGMAMTSPLSIAALIGALNRIGRPRDQDNDNSI